MKREGPVARTQSWHPMHTLLSLQEAVSWFSFPALCAVGCSELSVGAWSHTGSLPTTPPPKKGSLVQAGNEK